MRRIVLALSLSLTAGCAGGYKASYVKGAVTKQLATESYDVYSEVFNEKLDECDPANNDSVATKTELDECLGKFFDNEDHGKIEVAVKAYHVAAQAHTKAMTAVDGSDEERKAAPGKVLEAALELLSLFPEGEKLVTKLKSLTGAK